jgi:cardiolipin synthase
MELPDLLLRWLAVALHGLLAAIGAVHALLYKRDPRSALGWMVVCLAIPFLGPLGYYMFGINRVRTRAKKLRGRHFHIGYESGDTISEEDLADQEPGRGHIGALVSMRPLLEGNSVSALHNGEEAYPAMLESIHTAESQVLLSSYIFDSNDTGRRFVDALTAARDRGVSVRVLVDGIGELYSWPRISKLIARRGLPVARFLPPRLLPPALHLNLRTHRKILVADGRVGYTGGMNIGDRHIIGEDGRRRVVDMHFRLQGPVVRQLADAFWDDWHFATGETPEETPEPDWAVAPGRKRCRVITDGPNEDLDRIALVMQGAIADARRSVWIMTPYFLPSREQVALLQAAALRGVEVNVILPARNNLFYVHWATRNALLELLQWGVRVYYQPGPFVHTKLFLIDDDYCQIGTANMDPRSLRLNFELAVEIFDSSFAHSMIEHMQMTRARSRAVSFREIADRSLPVRFRDAIAWLFSPYL